MRNAIEWEDTFFRYLPWLRCAGNQEHKSTGGIDDTKEPGKYHVVVNDLRKKLADSIAKGVVDKSVNLPAEAVHT